MRNLHVLITFLAINLLIVALYVTGLTSLIFVLATAGVTAYPVMIRIKTQFDEDRCPLCGGMSWLHSSQKLDQCKARFEKRLNEESLSNLTAGADFGPDVSSEDHQNEDNDERSETLSHRH